MKAIVIITLGFWFILNFIKKAAGRNTAADIGLEDLVLFTI